MNRQARPIKATFSVRALAWLALASGLALAQAQSALTSPQSDPKRPGITQEARARVRQAMNAVGLVLVRNAGDTANPQPWSRGSAVVVREDGIVSTNLHVVIQDKTDRVYDELLFSLPGDKPSFWSGPRRYRMKLVLTSREYDLALLRIVSDEANRALPPSMIFPAIRIGNSRQVQVLDDVTIIGFPEKGGSTVTANLGVVEGTDVAGNWIKTDARLIHGNSGGAAVNNDGELIGIPSKVVVDEDKTRTYGAVGFLRPAHLVAAMLKDVRNMETAGLSVDAAPSRPPANHNSSSTTTAANTPVITVRGVVRSAADGKPIGGVRIGLIRLGSQDVNEVTLLTWGGTNPDGQFELNRPVPAGRYTLMARALGYQVFSRDVEIDQKSARLAIELRPSS